MRFTLGLCLLLTMLPACGNDLTSPPPPVTAALTCADPDHPGGFVACSLSLEEAGGFEVEITSISSCEAHGDTFHITAPVEATLTTDGCYDHEGKKITLAGPYPAGTAISAEAIAPKLKKAPSLKVEGEYPVWTLHFEDGVDNDFDDLTFTLRAIPAAH